MASTFYQRVLPEPPCISFLGQEGRRVFEEALAAGGMECFFPLVAQFRTQDEPAFCGLTTLVVALNALQVDPGAVWKGIWRWFHESMLSCCKENALVEKEGINLDEFVCLASCNGLVAETRRATKDGDDGSEDAFRAAVSRAVSRADCVLCASYDRKGLGQTGSGHFSPVGGYHKGRDLVLMLDVARFKYPPHWVPLKVLHAAMGAQDLDTGRPRGWIALTRLDADADRCAEKCPGKQQMTSVQALLRLAEDSAKDQESLRRILPEDARIP